MVSNYRLDYREKGNGNFREIMTDQRRKIIWCGGWSFMVKRRSRNHDQSSSSSDAAANFFFWKENFWEITQNTIHIDRSIRKKDRERKHHIMVLEKLRKRIKSFFFNLLFLLISWGNGEKKVHKHTQKSLTVTQRLLFLPVLLYIYNGYEEKLSLRF